MLGCAAVDCREPPPPPGMGDHLGEYGGSGVLPPPALLPAEQQRCAGPHPASARCTPMAVASVRQVVQPPACCQTRTVAPRRRSGPPCRSGGCVAVVMCALHCASPGSGGGGGGGDSGSESQLLQVWKKCCARPLWSFRTIAAPPLCGKCRRRLQCTCPTYLPPCGGLYTRAQTHYCVETGDDRGAPCPPHSLRQHAFAVSGGRARSKASQNAVGGAVLTACCPPPTDLEKGGGVGAWGLEEIE